MEIEGRGGEWRLMIWRCPACLRILTPQGTVLTSETCGARYTVVGGVPDFRSSEQRSADDERQVETAMSIVEGPAAGDRVALIHAYFGARESQFTGGPSYTAKRIAGTLDGFEKLSREANGWLRPLAKTDGVILDVGCGLGATIAAFTELGLECIGIDNRLDLLIVTRAILQASMPAQRIPELAAADALRLPLADASLGAVIYYDVIEHLPDAVANAMSEAQRVTSPGGWLALSTPNRFSLAAEPHVGVWGVGWLPRRFQANYATTRSGVDYAGTLLMSVSEVSKVIADNTDFEMKFNAPTIPTESIQSFAPRRATLARAYNSLSRFELVRGIMLKVGPFFHGIGRRPDTSSDTSTHRPPG
jgi:SAM-dependent methyltransferase